MKPFHFLCLLLIIAVVSTFNQTFAQNSSSSSPTLTEAEKEKEKNRREQERLREVEGKTVAMLLEIAADTDTLRLPVNRITVFSKTGVLLWKYDEKQARNMINDAAQEIINAQNASEETENYDSSPTDWEIQEARRQLVQTLAPQDAEFALQIFRQTRSAEIAALMQAGGTNGKNIFPNGNDYNRAQTEINTEQWLLNELARQDPKRALRLARELLEKGVSYSLFDLIEKVKEKEPEEASKLADDVLQQLREADFSVRQNERNLAVNFISRILQWQENNNAGGGKSKFSANESLLRALAEKLTSFWLRDSQAENYSYEISSFIPNLEKILPARVAQLRQRENEIKQKQLRNNPYDRLNQINQNADAETLVTEAENAPAEMKSQYYSYAANKLVSSDNTERARAVINLIPDRRTREYALQNLNSQLFYKAIGNGNVSEARRIASQMNGNRTMQISFYIQLFNHYRQKKEEKLAREILDEAALLVPTTTENREDVSARVQLANAYASFAPEMSLTMIEPMVRKINELINAQALINRFSSNQSKRPDEITSQFFMSCLSQFGFYFNPADFSKLALADFDRTANLAANFQRPEARIFTRLMIAQAILSQSNTSRVTVIYDLPVEGRTFISLNGN